MSNWIFAIMMIAVLGPTMVGIFYPDEEEKEIEVAPQWESEIEIEPETYSQLPDPVVVASNENKQTDEEFEAKMKADCIALGLSC